MRVYELRSNDNYQKIILKNESKWPSIIDDFKSGEKIESWEPIDVVIEDKKRKKSDFPTLMSIIPTFSANSVKCLENILKNHGQLLSLRCKEGEYYFFNVLTVVEAINDTKSQVLKFEDGRIMYVLKYVLKKIDYSKIPIFKLHNLLSFSTFVNEEFFTIVNENYLKGYYFNMVDIE